MEWNGVELGRVEQSRAGLSAQDSSRTEGWYGGVVWSGEEMSGEVLAGVDQGRAKWKSGE